MADDLFSAAGIAPEASQTDLFKAIGPTAVRAAPDNRTNWFEDALHQATGGLSDKVEAALKASGELPGGVQEGDFGDRYQKSLVNVRRDFGDYEAANPGWGGAKSAKAAGVIAPMLIAGPEAAAAKTMGGAALRSGLTGAAVGGAYGFGSTDDTSLGQDLTATGLGAAAGGVAGAAMPVVTGIAKVPFRLAARANVFGKDGIETAAGRVINDTKTNGNVFEQAPLPGMHLTTGQSTGDAGLLWLERNVSQATPMGAQRAADANTANNGAVRNAIGTLGDTGSDASAAMSAALDRSWANRKAANSAAWKAADVSNTGGISGFQFNDFMKKYVAGLPIPDQDIVPQDVMGTIEKMGAAKTQNLSDVQAIRSRLGSMATMAARSGDTNTARVLKGLADQTESFIDMKAANLGQKLPLYNQARADTREMKQAFDQPPAVRKALGVDSHGADRVPVSATADHFIRTGKGAREDFNAYLNAIATKDANGKVTYDPDGLKAAQDAFTQKFLGQVSNAGLDANGQQLVSLAKMQKFLSDYGHVINSPAFTQPQRDLVGRIAKATQMANRTVNARPPGMGSDTFQNLQGDKFIDALIGPGASKLVNGVATMGGAAAGYLTEGKIGAVAGMFGGEKVAGLINKLYAAPRDKVVDLITEAMHDPQLAKDLMMKASNSNAKLLPPPRRAKIFGVLGAQTAQPAVKALTSQ
ncbi:hypothetical protein [uncultured Devosia sp.]|uniref:hypothetical protein n=1 Tax=uncultured Devosia sp. TaxID=211434 RepID=UPI00261F352F|nr:hypothetical protein [uncultured Devosia sp.]